MNAVCLEIFHIASVKCVQTLLACTVWGGRDSLFYVCVLSYGLTSAEPSGIGGDYGSPRTREKFLRPGRDTLSVVLEAHSFAVSFLLDQVYAHLVQLGPVSEVIVESLSWDGSCCAVVVLHVAMPFGKRVDV